MATHLLPQYSSLKKIIAQRAPDLTEKCHSLCDCRGSLRTKNVKWTVLPYTIYKKSCYTTIVGRSETEGCLFNDSVRCVAMRLSLFVRVIVDESTPYE